MVCFNTAIWSLSVSHTMSSAMIAEFISFLIDDKKVLRIMTRHHGNIG